MSSAKYCYQCPTLLGSGYQKNPSGGILCYEYKIVIEGSPKGFKLLSPSYIGEIPTFSLKMPLKKTLKSGDKKLKTIRKKVKVFYLGTSITPDNEVKFTEELNKNMWNLIIPNNSDKCDSFQTEVSELKHDSEGLFNKKKYEELKKQYLILPINIKSTDDGKLTYDLDINLAKNLFSPPKKSSNALKKGNIYKHIKENKLYIIKDTCISLGSASCFDFISTLFVYCKGQAYDQRLESHINSMLELVTGLGLKNTDLKKVKFLDFLYEHALQNNQSASNYFLSPLRSFVFKYGDRKKIESEILVFGMEATNGITVDLNYYENLSKFKTNKYLAKKETNFGEYQLFLSTELLNTKVKHIWMDMFNHLPAIMVNIERFALVREFKIYHGFLFMKNYSLYKALCSRSYDKIVNNETLETLGDTALKTIITLHLYKNKSHLNEGGMTSERTKLINNKFLGKKGLENGIQFYLKSQYTPVKNWVPPYFTIKKKGNETYKEEQILSDKMIADSVEAIIGAALVSTKRLYEPLQVLKRLGILEEFDFEGYEKYFTTKLNPDLSCFEKLDAIVNKNISYRKLLRLGDADIYDNIRRFYNLKNRFDKIVKKPKGKAKGEEVELATISNTKCFKNYVSGIFLPYKRKENSNIESYLIKTLYKTLETRHLGYIFKNKSLMSIGTRPKAKVNKDNEKEYQRLEFLGDAVIEVLTIYIARKVFIHLKKSYTPEMLHAVKVVVLSTEGLARIFLHLKLHRYFLLGSIEENIPEIRAFIENLDPHLEFKHLWWQNKVKAPKMLADTVEALMGAVFIDGGWEALSKVFGRIVTPMVYYCCKFFDQMGTDLVHDLISYFAKRGVKCEFKSSSNNCSVYLYDESGKRKILTTTGSNEKECKRKAAVQFMCEDKYKNEFTKVQIDFEFGDNDDIVGDLGGDEEEIGEKVEDK